jgi:hypothetical protein
MNQLIIKRMNSSSSDSEVLSKKDILKFEEAINMFFKQNVQKIIVIKNSLKV